MRQSPRQPRQELSSPSTESSTGNSFRVEDSEAAGKGGQLRFSTIHRGELEYIYDTAIAEDVIPMVDKTPTLSSLALKSQLKGYVSEEQWEAVCRENTSLFSSQGLQVSTCPHLLHRCFDSCGKIVLVGSPMVLERVSTGSQHPGGHYLRSPP